MESRFISATQIGKERGLSTAQIFKDLIDKGYINPMESPKKWELTEKGSAAGGRYTVNKDREYIEWPADIELTALPSTENNITNNTLSANKPFPKTANTEGEKLIKEFFREFGIKYEYQVPVRNLSHDNKAHRIADFYLPKFDAYVEFFGLWNAGNEFRENYKQKKLVYKQNQVPCVFLYPENLGYLHFAIDHRLLETLKENHKEEALKKYKWWKLWNASKGNFVGIVLFTFLFFYFLATKESGKLFMVLLVLYNIYRVISLWYFIYVKNSYNLNRVFNE